MFVFWKPDITFDQNIAENESCFVFEQNQYREQKKRVEHYGDDKTFDFLQPEIPVPEILLKVIENLREATKRWDKFSRWNKN